MSDPRIALGKEVEPDVQGPYSAVPAHRDGTGDDGGTLDQAIRAYTKDGRPVVIGEIWAAALGRAGSKVRIDAAAVAQRIVDTLNATPSGRPQIVCLCGSSRFIDQMAVIAWEAEKLGKIALSLHLLPHWYTNQPDHQAEHEGVAAAMDDLHLKKIDLADEVFVVNVGGYIGESTKSEITYATERGKPIKYLEPVHD